MSCLLHCVSTEVNKCQRIQYLVKHTLLSHLLFATILMFKKLILAAIVLLIPVANPVHSKEHLSLLWKGTPFLVTLHVRWFLVNSTGFPRSWSLSYQTSSFCLEGQCESDLLDRAPCKAIWQKHTRILV